VGIGTTNHIILARLVKEHNLNMKHVPYKGDGEIIPAMLGGMFISLPGAQRQLFRK